MYSNRQVVYSLLSSPASCPSTSQLLAPHLFPVKVSLGELLALGISHLSFHPLPICLILSPSQNLLNCSAESYTTACDTVIATVANVCGFCLVKAFWVWHMALNLFAVCCLMNNCHFVEHPRPAAQSLMLHACLAIEFSQPSYDLIFDKDVTL